MYEPKSRALWDRGAGCLGKLETTSSALLARVQALLSGVGTYLPDTVGQECRLFKWCQKLPPSLTGAGVQALLSGVLTYLPVTVEQGCRLYKRS